MNPAPPSTIAVKCIVIGNGPSLRGFDLTRLSAVDTIGMNAAYRYWARIGWYPTHYACLDDELIETHHLEIARLIEDGLCRSAFLSGQFLSHHPEAANDSRYVFLDEFIPYWFERRGKQFGLQDRTGERAFQSSRMSKLTTGSHAVRYAIWRGYTDIALIGIDLRYVERIPESVAGEGIRLSIAQTPDHNPNYFFDDYQRTGDRFNVPNPDAHGGDLHLASFRALRDDLVASGSSVRVVNANRDSELSRQGVFPFHDLATFIGVRPLGAVVVPAVASSRDQIVANLEYWARPEATPTLWPRANKPDLIFAFNNRETAEVLEPAVSAAYAAGDLSRYFESLSFERLELYGEADLYQTDYTRPAGVQGHKAGPNNQFFETMRRVRNVGRYVFYMEPDCVPIRSDWLGQLMDRLEREDAWILGSIYRGRGTLDRRFMRHLNGNAIYAVGDPAFQDFLADLERRLAGLLAADPRYAYDLALEVLFTGASCDARATEEERALWHYFQQVAHRFQATDYIQNISARIDVQEPDRELLDKVRAGSPGTYVLHNSPLARTLTASNGGARQSIPDRDDLHNESPRGSAMIATNVLGPAASQPAGLSPEHASDLDRVHRPRLRALKAARTSRRCFIIGDGRSLTGMDLSKLRSEVTFASNAFVLKMPGLDWSPTYYVVEDQLVGEDWAEELNAHSGTTKLFAASLAPVVRPDDNTIFFDHRPGRRSPDGFDFSFEADANTWSVGSVTYTCLQLAAYLGFQEIYLVGVDADDSSHGPDVDVVHGAYAEARRATEARGVSIVNATVGGKLEAFRRIDYEMLFRPAPAERLLLIDHTQMGNATATGEVKAAILGNWPTDLLMQVYDGGDGRVRATGGPLEVGADDGLAEQIAAFDPDLILYRPVPRTDVLHDFAMDLIAQAHLPLAVWIVDDWPSAYAQEDPLQAARLDADLQWLIARADARFSIGPAMSAAFHERYGKLFVPIANGVDPAHWPPAKPRPTRHVKVRYAGSLAENMTLASVGLVARAVEKLAESGLDISLEIKTHRHWHSTAAGWVTDLRHTTVSTSDLPMAEYRRWLADADILVIAYNFDGRSRDYIRYSLANKLPECLASGAAVLAVGPDDVSTIATMAALDVGERVTVADEELIGETLRRLAASPEERFELARRAQSVAFSLFGVNQARQAFEATVGRVAAAHRAGEFPRDLQAHVEETAVIASLLGDRRGSAHVMLDVGAHGGSSAVHFDRLGWTIHCFEPHPATRKGLAARFAGHENVHIDPRAIGDTQATNVPLYESSESSGIATLRPFHASHRAAGTVDLTTIADVARERALARVDFLKIDVEGLDLAVLRGVPWSELRPEVVQCEFEDAKTLGLGHSWRDIGAFLHERGYAVYVSEWHPITRYGTRHHWRRVAPFNPHLDVDPDAWGNLLAFRFDPGWTAIRRAFNRYIERGGVRQAAPPPRPRAIAPPQAQGPGQPDVAPGTDGRPGGARLRRSLKRQAPILHRGLRRTRRAVAPLWRWKGSAIPLAVLLVLWTLLGFVPALAPVSWLIWTAALSAVTLAVLYATYRAYGATVRVPRKVAKLRRSRDAERRRLAEANDRIGRLERALTDGAKVNADLLRKVKRLEASVAKARPAGREQQAKARGRTATNAKRRIDDKPKNGGDGALHRQITRNRKPIPVDLDGRPSHGPESRGRDGDVPLIR